MVLLTDGCIHDMDLTKKEIVRLSYLPVSIVIVGIGNNEDFTDMKILDADSEILTDENGRPAARDIVQFVDFKDLREMAEVEVSDYLLQEIPDQFVDYMVMKKI